MNRSLIIVVAFGIALGDAQAAESLFCGHSLGQALIENVAPPCPKNSVCFGSWTRREIVIDKLLAGPALPHQITAAAIQTSQYLPEYERRFKFFVVKPIDDKEKRILLGAEFFLLKWEKDDGTEACSTLPVKETIPD